MAYLVLIETSGNQHYIFSTNRLRENAGASEIIFQAGTKLVVEAVGEVLKKTGKNNPYQVLPENSGDRVAQLVKIGEENEPLDKHGIEIIVSTSGKALLLVNSKETGEAIISHVTRTVLEDSPGLSVMGIVGDEEITFPGTKSQAHKAVQAIHKDIEKLKSRLPSPLVRFPTIPFVTPCESSGLPANQIAERPGQNGDGAYSNVVLAKRDVGRDGFKRVADDIKEPRLSHSPETLDKMNELDWSAIVHADGNGFGALFLTFDIQEGMKDKRTARDYFNLLRRFSCSLELCGLAAFKSALAVVETKTYRPQHGKKRDFLPIVPLILGGDDLTVVMDGRQALKFTAAYQRAFEAATVQEDFDGFDNAIREVTGGQTLGSGAGVAIVKPHYPFHRAYQLAEKLISSAKTSKSILGTPAISALDFHILFDNGATSLEELRERLGYDKESGPKERLSLRPYVVSDDAALKKADKLKDPWIEHRKWDDLNQCAMVLARASRGDREDSPIPNSQLHMLRDALHEGREVAEARYELVRHRYTDLGKDLYITDCGHETAWLIDAMEVIDIEQLYQEKPEKDDQNQQEDAA